MRERECRIDACGARRSLVLRFLGGTLYWFLWLDVVFGAAMFMAVLAMNPLQAAFSNDAVNFAGLLATYVASGVALGWLGAVIAAKLHLDRPTWWAPSMAALLIMIVAAAVNGLSHGWLYSMRGIVICIETLGPALLGQWLLVRQRRLEHVRQTAMENEAGVTA